MAIVYEVSGNNSINTSQPINIGDTVIGSLIKAGGYESYSITVSAPTAIQLTYSVLSSSLSSWTYFIGLEDPQYKFITASYLGYQQTSTTFYTYLPSAGTYYVITQDANVFSSNKYTFSTHLANNLLGNLEQESNDTFSTANKLDLGKIDYGQLKSSSDIDTYLILIASKSNFYFSFNAPSNSLIDSSGNRICDISYNITLLDSNNNIIQKIITNQTNPSPTTFANLNTGQYYIQISENSNYSGDEYSFIANTLNLSQATKINLNSKLNDSLTSSAPIKLYSINLVAGNLYEISCNVNLSPTTGQLINPKLSLINSSGIKIETNWTTASKIQLTDTPINSYLTPSIEIIAPTTGQYYITVDSSQNLGGFSISTNQIDLSALIQDEVWKGNSQYPNSYWASTNSQPLHLTYSFMQTNPSKTEVGFIPMTKAQQIAVVNALQAISSVCNVIFSLAQDEASANILYGTSDQSSSGGVAVSIKTKANGNFLQEAVFIDNSGTNATSNSITSANGYGYEAVLHETGHALGLKHPGNYAVGQLITKEDGPFAPAGWDNREFTLMSYVNNENTNLYHSGLASIDIAALQSLYGIPQFSQKITFTVPDSSAIIISTPYAALGSTIDVSKETIGSTISLLEGSYSTIGVDVNGNQIHNNVNIAWGSQFTNVIGGSFDDTIYCNNLNDSIIIGKKGNNYIFGGAGIDTVIFDEPLKNFSLNRSNGNFLINDTTNNYGNETLNGISRVRFSDVSIAYDVLGNAGNVLLILGAVFGQSFLQNRSYIGIGLYNLDNGISFSQLSALALSAVGANTPTQIVNLLYTNIIGIQPTSTQAQPFIQMLQNGTSVADLAVMAENSVYNQSHVNLTGIQTSGLGIQYIPYSN